MANVETRQCLATMSINRDRFMDVVVRNDNLSRKDLRVILHLMSFLDSVDFKRVHAKNIAGDLRLKKKDVEESIQNLLYEGIIDEGSTASVKNGLRLKF